MMQCHALSTMERLAGVILGVGFMDLDSDTRMKILDLLDDCGVLKMSAVDRESNELLESRKQEIFDRVAVAMWLRDGENRELEIQDGAGALYQIQTERKAIHKIPCWGLRICPPKGEKIRRGGALFYRSGEWILNLLNRYKDFDKRQWRAMIYRFHKLDELKQILKSQPKSAEYYTISDDGAWGDSEFVDDSDTDPADPSLKQWLVDDGRGLAMQQIQFCKQIGCNWEFRLAFDPYVLSDNAWPQYLRGYIVFKPNSKIDIWYELGLNFGYRENWILNGYIQDIHQDELRSIYKRQPSEWVNADEPLYSAWNYDDSKSEWRSRFEPSKR